jgi:hypothetical protein
LKKAPGLEYVFKISHDERFADLDCNTSTRIPKWYAPNLEDGIFRSLKVAGDAGEGL